uniref:15-cis-phytoene synthase n=1 Tax=Tetraselmis sp. GSL018 TaxID=582737 RepID=A0A061S9Y5_9CHLO|mmetsp:Transcript_14268/g.33804  ORF Transcript_14268/g.33804 Transcript_14268/m.33804 type:complete len:246 (-) Transcript_14268:275-1012(-)
MSGATLVKSSPHLQYAVSGLRKFSSAPSSFSSAFKYCRNQVQTYDRENYLWCLLLPREAQAAAFSLRAFNVETALVADASKELPIQQMRLLWWRDSISSIFRGPMEAIPSHPVLQALSFVASRRPISQYWLARVLQTREADLEGSSPSNIADVEAYAEGTLSALNYLQLQGAGITSQAADHAASHLGKACGLATLLRGTPHHAGNRRCYIPAELLAKHKVSQEEIYAGRPSEGLKVCCGRNAELK